MDNWNLFLVGVVLGVFSVVGFISLLGNESRFYMNGYEQGQVDALTGKIKYELVIQPDSTRTWEKIKNETIF
jgi:hypothetical protein